jgi:hypothetical protein
MSDRLRAGHRFVRENAYRDVWLLIITGLMLWALVAQQGSLNRLERDRQALCTLRADLRDRITQGNAFLVTHPHGIPGIPANTLRVSIVNQQHTLSALQPLDCRGL